MPIGTSDGQQYEDDYEAVLAAHKQLDEKPLSQGPRIEITPANMIKPPDNVLPVPPFRDGPVVDPTMPIDPQELPVRKEMDKVEGRVASNENNAPTGNVEPPRGMQIAGKSVSITPSKELFENQDWDAIENLIDETMDKNKLGVGDLIHVKRPNGNIDTYTPHGEEGGRKRWIKVPSIKRDLISEVPVDPMQHIDQLIASQPSFLDRLNKHFQDMKEAHDRGGTKALLEVAKSDPTMTDLAAGFMGSIRGVGGRITNAMERATTKIDDISQRMEDRIQGKITEVREGNLRGKMQNIEDRIAYRLPENSRLREKLDQRAEDWSAGEQMDAHYNRLAANDVIFNELERLYPNTSRIGHEHLDAVGDSLAARHGGLTPILNDALHQAHSEVFRVNRPFADDIPRYSAEQMREYREARRKDIEAAHPVPPEALANKYHVTPRERGGDHIMYKDGKLVATMKVYIDFPQKRVPDPQDPRGYRMETYGQRNELSVDSYYGIEGDFSIHELGPKAQLEYLKQLRAMYPETKSIGGFRVSGMRGEAGKPAYTSKPWTALDKPNRKTLAGFVSILAGAEAMSGDEAKAADVEPIQPLDPASLAKIRLRQMQYDYSLHSGTRSIKHMMENAPHLRNEITELQKLIK